MYIKTPSDFLRAHLPGSWRLSRNSSGGDVARGEAVIKQKKAGSLLYAECGKLYLPNGELLNFERYYIYNILPEQAEIYLADSQGQKTEFLYNLKFKELAQGKLRTVATHHCKQDIYQLEAEFTPQAIRFLVEVAGPKKGYSLETLLEKISD